MCNSSPRKARLSKASSLSSPNSRYKASSRHRPGSSKVRPRPPPQLVLRNGVRRGNSMTRL